MCLKLYVERATKSVQASSGCIVLQEYHSGTIVSFEIRLGVYIKYTLDSTGSLSRRTRYVRMMRHSDRKTIFVAMLM